MQAKTLSIGVLPAGAVTATTDPVTGRTRLSRVVTRGPALTAFVGDSITNDVPAGQYGAQEYGTHALELSAGSMIPCGKFGQGGMGLTLPGNQGQTWGQTLAQIASASPRPDRVHLLIGTNDIGAGVPAAVLIPAYVAAVSAIEELGIEVIPSELTPRNDLTGAALIALHTFNVWVNRWSRDSGRRCQHLYAACVDRGGSGNWAAGYNRDSVHPSVIGARIMGQIAANAASANYKHIPYLVASTSDATAFANGLMVTDVVNNGSQAQTPGDGIPDGWGRANTFSSEFAHALASAASDAIGNWYTQSRTAVATGSPTIRTTKLLAKPGDLVQIGCRLKCAGIGATLRLAQSNGTAWVDATTTGIASPVQMSLGQIYDADGVFMLEGRVIGSTAVSVCAEISTIGSDSGGYARFAQFTMRNLTAIGLDF